MYNPYNKKTLSIIKKDLKEIGINGRNISRAARNAQKLMKVIPLDPEDWKKEVDEILSSCHHIIYIVTEKRGRF